MLEHIRKGNHVKWLLSPNSWSTETRMLLRTAMDISIP